MTLREIQPRYLGAFLIAGILAAFWSSAPLLAAQAVIKGHILHVEVLLQHQNGQPVGDLTAKDFVASQQGQVLPVTVIHPVLGNIAPQGRYVPTRMLVIFAPSVANSSDAFSHLLAALEPVWQRGWQVAATRSDGCATGYATTGAQLQQMWTAPDRPAASAEAAVGNLKSFLGRSIVMYLAGSPQTPKQAPKWLQRLATAAMAQTFMVDGGVAIYSSAPVFLPDIEFSPGPNEPANRGLVSDQRVEPAIIPSAPHSSKDLGRTKVFRDGQYHEVNVREAVLDAMHAALGYYDLRVRYPSTGSIPSSTTLSLEIKEPPPLLVTAQVYGKGEVPKLKVTRK